MVVHMLVGCVSELKNLFKSSDSDGVRRQARGALQALGVAMETASATGTRVNNFTSSGHPGATSAAIGNLMVVVIAVAAAFLLVLFGTIVCFH